MISYVLKLLLLTSFSFLTIFFYYQNPAHIENFDGYFPYVFVMGVLYLTYKVFQTYTSSSSEVRFTPMGIGLAFLLHLFVLSGFFFAINGGSFFSGIMLFFKIISYLILPIFIVFLALGVGKKLSSYLPGYKQESIVFQFLLALGIGFFVLLTAIFLLGIVGVYTMTSILILFAILLVITFREFGYYIEGVFSHEIIFAGHKETGSIIERLSPRLLSSEFLFIIISFILSVNLINIVRPFPIGWDDLGAYMNIPHLLSSAGSLLSFGGMFSWQSLTGVGFLFGSATQAFFINNIGGVLSAIVLVLVTGEFLRSHTTKKQTLIHIPLLIATIFTALPMVIFQQAKDMKLDTGLFFISVIVVYALVYLYHKPKSEILLKHGTSYRLWYFLVIGLLAGLAFSIKFTTLILIISLLAVLFYVRLGVFGFLGYLGVFLGVFTVGDLWSFMNVITTESNDVRNIFSAISGGLGVVFLGIAYVKNSTSFRVLFLKVSVFLLGVILALTPWLLKNIYQSYPSITIANLLSGNAQSYIFDPGVLYTQEEVERIQAQEKQQRETDSATTKNEDYGRYLGYEEGINNYLKLPWNLTMQINQGGEFTDISFIFLALIPLLFLFLPYRHKYYGLAIVGTVIFEILLFIYAPTSELLTTYLGSIFLPEGYIFLLVLFLSWIYLIHVLKHTTKTFLLKVMIIFLLLYTFLWTISAFGIVWYGIVMYFGFLMFIAIGSYYMTQIKEDMSSDDKLLRLFGSVILLGIVSVYFFFSTIPHGFNNLKNASYTEFKTGKVLAVEAPFLYHPDYLDILFWVNIDDAKKRDFINEQVSSVIAQRVQGFEKMSISQVVQLLKEINASPKPEIQAIRPEAKQSLLRLYEGILEPTDVYKNTAYIYRIGTFLKYYISENDRRLFEDSLVSQFNTYIYDTNLDIAVQRMKYLGLRYLLVDLNAATIDRDPEHRLTARYENLLRTFTSEKLTLIRSDSLCLELALDLYRTSQKTEQDMMDYLMLAGANHESYFDGKEINRGVKQVGCYQKMINLINEGKVTDQSFSYLKGVQAYLTNPDNASQFQSEQDVLNFFRQYVKPGFKVLFKIEE